MRATHLLSLALLASTLAGCMFQNVSTGERLRDAVTGINDEMRWSRMDLAIQRVHPTFKEEYAQTHYRWGEIIQIADMDLLNVQLEEDGDAAMSIVAVSWYRYDTMTLHRTVIRQQWVLVGGAFALEAERVLNGEERLLEPPPLEEEEEEAERDDERGSGRVARAP